MHVWNNKKIYICLASCESPALSSFFFPLSLAYVHVGLYREELGSLVKTMIFCQRNQPTVAILICVEVVWVIDNFFFCIFFIIFFLFKRWDKVATGWKLSISTRRKKNFSLFAAIVAFCHLAYFFPIFWLLC